VKFFLPELCHPDSARNFKIFRVWTWRFFDDSECFSVRILSNFSADTKDIFICKMQYWKKFIFFKITYSYKTLQNLLVKYSYSQSFSKTAFAFSKWCPGFVSDKLFQNYQLEFLQTLLKKKLYVCSKLLWNQFTGLCFSSFYDYSNLHICIYVQVTSL